MDIFGFCSFQSLFAPGAAFGDHLGAERLFKMPLQEVMHSGGAHGSRAGEEEFTLEMLSKSSAYTTYIGMTMAAEDEPEYTREIFRWG